MRIFYDPPYNVLFSLELVNYKKKNEKYKIFFTNWDIKFFLDIECSF